MKIEYDFCPWVTGVIPDLTPFMGDGMSQLRQWAEIINLMRCIHTHEVSS